MPAADPSVRSAPDPAAVRKALPRRPQQRVWRRWTPDPSAPDPAVPDPAAPPGGTARGGTPLRRALPMLGHLRRTPDQLAVLLAATVLCCAGAGLAAGLDVAHRQARVRAVITHGGPVLDAARDLYRSLSDAHATATVAFLFIGVSPSGGSGGAGPGELRTGVEPAELRIQYEQHIATAAAALRTAAAGVADGAGAAEVALLTGQLPQYTGLMEDARIYNRLGQTLGVAYLREASALMQDAMLVTARKLYQIQADQLAVAQAEISRPRWLSLGLGGLALGCLLGAQVYLTRRTRRLVNLGLLGATLATLAWLMWFGVATARAAERASTGRQAGFTQARELNEAQVAVLRARGDEALALVTRGSIPAYENDFGAQLDLALRALGGDDDRRPLAEAIGAWQQRYASLRADDDGSDASHDRTVRLVADSRPQGSTAARFEAVDRGLQAAIVRADTQFDSDTARAWRALAGVGAGIAAGALVATVAAAAGMAPRLWEYR